MLGKTLEQIMDSPTHWADPTLVNPVTRFFVAWVIQAFPAGRTMSGVGDSYPRFHSWVNEQTHPTNIPPEVTNLIWNHRERNRSERDNMSEMTHPESWRYPVWRKR